MISVVIPTRNRPGDLLTCLDRLASQGPGSPDFEVIIVDDHSSEPSKELIECFAKLRKLSVSYVCNLAGEGAAIARNYGVSCAAGQIIAFLDDDSFPEVNWLKNVEKAMRKKNTTAITGRILAYDGGRLFSRARQMRYELRQRGALHQHVPVQFLAGGNSAIWRKEFEACGGFDTKFIMMHDRELALKLSSQGKHCFYADDVVVRHRHYKGVLPLIRQSFESGYYRFLLEREYPAVKPWSVADQLRSGYDLVRYALSKGSRLVPALGALLTEFLHGCGYLFFSSLQRLSSSARGVSTSLRQLAD